MEKECRESQLNLFGTNRKWRDSRGGTQQLLFRDLFSFNLHLMANCRIFSKTKSNFY